MSLFRTSLAPCRRNILQIASRTVSTESSSAPAPSESKETEIVSPPPARDVMTADVVSGAPGAFLSLIETLKLALTRAIVELRHRSVRIYQPTRNTMQSGPNKGDRWRIDHDILLGGGRWENPLMGWASS